MALFIIHKSNNQAWRTNPNISLATKGFMLTILDNIPNNSFMTWGKLVNLFPEGRRVLERSREELKQNNLLREYNTAMPDGSMLLRVVEIFEEPMAERIDISAYIKINGIQIAEVELPNRG